MGIAEDLIIIIVVGLTAGLIANKLMIPPIIGYILAGIAIGPYTGGLTVSDIPRIELLAEIGVALLLFSIGLDFSFKELKSVKAISLIGTPIQILLLIAFGYGIGFYMQLPLKNSIVLGMVISLSSTMVVLKTLMSRGLIGTLSSKVMIGILIVQDLAAIPLMLIIPNLQSLENNIIQLILILFKAILILIAIIFISIRIIPRFLKIVVKLNSRELFLITITAIGLGVGYLTHLLGLSLAFGAFIAGLVINESDYSHQALNDIIPLRDIFGLVFFSSIGMLVNPVYIYKNLSLVFLLVLLIILSKVFIFSSLSIVFKYYNIIPLALGFGLAQVGEFSFVLARTALKSNIIDTDFYTLILSVSIITMIISPFLSLLASPLYSLKRKFLKHEEFQTINLPYDGLNNHIVIAGGGRVGYQIATVFHKLEYPFVIIEQDFRRFENSKKAGFPIIYGDASQETVLLASNLNRARLIIITIPLISTAKEIVNFAMRVNRHIKIIARADELSCVKELFKMKIFEVVQPEFEASLEIVRQSLVVLDVPLKNIYSFTDSIRQENYTNIKIDKLDHSILSEIKKTPFFLELNWIEVTKTSLLIGKSIKELEIRSRTGISIVGILRKGKLIPNPDVNFIFEENDYMAIIGLPENIALFENTMIQ
ncbi:MAG: cation:proton antiporter [Spirochaetota bacterium]|nr:cation:proton antiporter [Spirochaetota bacterium]